MTFFSFMLLIVIAGLVYDLVRHKNATRADQHESMSAMGQAREEELQREVEDLRERIKVLERIAIDTNETRALSDEIERLRDK